jgi:cytochrome c oxidase cbb3-type subunit 3/ubiquinol-cytochrome c reductase cytochrome c subunit
MRNRFQVWLTLAMLALVMLAVAACGGGGATSGQTGAAQPSAPKAAEPDFASVAKGADKLFVAVDEVKKAYDAKMDFVIVDARPATDFAAGHIKGAVNATYFEVEKHLSKLPKDKWIITYCACPHAEAEQAARTLMKNGYTKVKVIDEGYYGWADKGWPTEKS